MNPLSGTSATDDGHVGPLVDRPVERVKLRIKNVGVAMLDVRVHEPGVLAVHAGEHPRVPLGAVIVLTRGNVGGIRSAVAYPGIPEALRGEGYAQRYYGREIPDLRRGRNVSANELENLHGADLADPETAATRNDALSEVAARFRGSGSKRKRAAASDATRGQKLTDRRGRKNHQAAAMANSWAVLQLDTMLQSSIRSDARVSASLRAIARLLGSTWKAIHDVDIELLSMDGWWAPGRARPIPFDRAARLAERVERVHAQLALIDAAPYAGMPLLSVLDARLVAFQKALTDPDKYRHGAPVQLHEARRVAGALLIHPAIMQARSVAGVVRRFREPITDEQRRQYMLATDRACEQVADTLRAVFPASFERRLVAAKKVGTEPVFDATRACRELDRAASFYRGVSAN